MTYTVHVIDSLEKAINDQTDLGVAVYSKRIECWHKDWSGPREIPLTYARALESIKREDAGKPFKPFDFTFEA